MHLDHTFLIIDARANANVKTIIASFCICEGERLQVNAIRRRLLDSKRYRNTRATPAARRTRDKINTNRKKTTMNTNEENQLPGIPIQK